MMKKKMISILIVLLLWAPVGSAREMSEETEPATARPLEPQTDSTFANAAQSVHQRLEQSLAELEAVREQAARETVPLNRQLSDLETELVKVRLEYQQTSRLLDTRTLNLSNLRSEIKSRQEEATYLSNLLGEYIRNFESRLHITEIQRYRDALEEAKLAPENSNLSEQEKYEAQAHLLSVSLQRLDEALGGTRFDGTAVNPSGLVKDGTFVLIGPAALFKSQDGQDIGTAEQRLGSLEPAIIPFGSPEDTQAASDFITTLTGSFPLDPTLGNAHKIEETKETILEHIQKGGPVMYPIFGLAGAAMLVALFKLVGFLFLGSPSEKRIRELLTAVSGHNEENAKRKVRQIHGPVGKMLTAGVDHINEPTELIEEVMYEKVLSSRLKLERFLPFIAISAASAPLLGLLGTVTGIINTFKLITVFGSGDVKTLSGGISEALITTEFGLIVAIPSLLIHAFLSRKSRGVINQMEKAAIAFVNQLHKTPFYQKQLQAGSPSITHEQLQQIIANLGNRSVTVTPLPSEEYLPDSAGRLMNPRVVSISKNATVNEAIRQIRSTGITDDLDTVYIVDDQGRYAGYVLVNHLLTRPEQARIESLAETKPLYVRVDTHENEVRDLFTTHDLINMPVLDHNDRLVGRVTRKTNGDGR